MSSPFVAPVGWTMMRLETGPELSLFFERLLDNA